MVLSKQNLTKKRNNKYKSKSKYNKKNVSCKNMRGGSARKRPSYTDNDQALVEIKDIPPSEYEQKHLQIVEAIHFGYDPFNKDGILSFSSNKYNANGTFEKVTTNYNSKKFIKWCKDNDDKVFIMMRMACAEGYINSLISLIDLFYPNNTIPNNILYKLYFVSIFWRYGRSNNPVRRYLFTMYFERLNIPMNPDIRLLLEETFPGQKINEKFGRAFVDFLNHYDEEKEAYVLDKEPNIFAHIFDYNKPLLDKTSRFARSRVNKPTNNTELDIDLAELQSAKTLITLKKIYKSFALKYHPDKKRNNADAPKKFNIITQKYKELLGFYE